MTCIYVLDFSTRSKLRFVLWNGFLSCVRNDIVNGG